MGNELFVNMRYINSPQFVFPIYMLNKGVIKEVKWNKRVFQSVGRDNLWCKLSDLDRELQSKLHDMTITGNELTAMYKKKEAEYTTWGNELDGDVKIFVNDKTMVLPIVGNLLPSDGTNAYTAVIKNGKVSLDPILVCWGCHWSDLFTGQTKYKNNVFCLASDLTEAQRELYAEDMIPLREAINYIESPEISASKKI